MNFYAKKLKMDQIKLSAIKIILLTFMQKKIKMDQIKLSAIIIILLAFQRVHVHSSLCTLPPF